MEGAHKGAGAICQFPKAAERDRRRIVVVGAWAIACTALLDLRVDPVQINALDACICDERATARDMCGTSFNPFVAAAITFITDAKQSFFHT